MPYSSHNLSQLVASRASQTIQNPQRDTPGVRLHPPMPQGSSLPVEIASLQHPACAAALEQAAHYSQDVAISILFPPSSLPVSKLVHSIRLHPLCLSKVNAMSITWAWCLIPLTVKTVHNANSVVGSLPIQQIQISVQVQAPVLVLWQTQASHLVGQSPLQAAELALLPAS